MIYLGILQGTKFDARVDKVRDQFHDQYLQWREMYRELVHNFARSFDMRLMNRRRSEPTAEIPHESDDDLFEEVLEEPDEVMMSSNEN